MSRGRRYRRAVRRSGPVAHYPLDDRRGPGARDVGGPRVPRILWLIPVALVLVGLALVLSGR